MLIKRKFKTCAKRRKIFWIPDNRFTKFPGASCRKNTLKSKPLQVYSKVPPPPRGAFFANFSRTLAPLQGGFAVKCNNLIWFVVLCRKLYHWAGTFIILKCTNLSWLVALDRNLYYWVEIFTILRCTNLT